MTLWLASFPRSGNTLLRQVLHAGWGIITGSVFPDDLGDNLGLVRSCGHVELKRIKANGCFAILNPHNLPIKTHLPPGLEPDDAIYMLRDGRAACVSLWQFFDKQVELDDIICGRTDFGTWSDHVLAWTSNAERRVVLRYEEMVGRSDTVIQQLAAVFGQPTGDPLAPIGLRDALASLDGKWIRRESDWRSEWSSRHEDLFMRHNHTAFQKYYAAEAPWCATPSHGHRASATVPVPAQRRHA